MRNHVIVLPGLWQRTIAAFATVACTLCALPTDAQAGGTASSPECGGSINGITLDPTATSTTFAPGTLIIPMDSCYNPDTPGNSGPKNVGGSCGAGPTYTCYNQYG